MRINVLLAPSLISSRLKDTLCAVIDLLRATTTISVAIASGAAEVYPCVSSAEGREYARLRARDSYLLGGEESCALIPGFDLGNSPAEYLDSEKIRGKTIIFSTTNGTPVIRKAYAATGNPVFLAALSNLSAVSTALVKTALDKSYPNITLVCSGRHGNTSLEDTLCAGLIIARMEEELAQAALTPELTDSALLAERFARDNAKNIIELVLESEAGRFLQKLNYEEDIDFCCRLDTVKSVPVFDGSRIKGQ